MGPSCRLGHGAFLYLPDLPDEASRPPAPLLRPPKQLHASAGIPDARVHSQLLMKGQAHTSPVPALQGSPMPIPHRPTCTPRTFPARAPSRCRATACPPRRAARTPGARGTRSCRALWATGWATSTAAVRPARPRPRHRGPSKAPPAAAARPRAPTRHKRPTKALPRGRLECTGQAPPRVIRVRHVLKLDGADAARLRRVSVAAAWCRRRVHVALAAQAVVRRRIRDSRRGRVGVERRLGQHAVERARAGAARTHADVWAGAGTAAHGSVLVRSGLPGSLSGPGMGAGTRRRGLQTLASVRLFSCAAKGARGA
eukprot:359489-Chlamydomonas_euryale.AAC.4